MITKKAKLLAENYRKSGQSQDDEISSYSDLMDELYSNCDPTLDEFSELIGSSPSEEKKYYEFHFKKSMWKKVISGGRK